MNHSEFVQKYKSNQIKIHIDHNESGFMYQDPILMPRNLRARQANIRACGFGGIILGLVSFFFLSWWMPLGILMASSFILRHAQKDSARGVLEASLQDPYIFDYACEKQVIRITELD